MNNETEQSVRLLLEINAATRDSLGSRLEYRTVRRKV